MGIVEGSCKYRARSLYSEKICFIEETWDARLGGRLVSKHSSDPRIAKPEVRIQVRNLVRVVELLLSLLHRGSKFGENSFYRAPCGKRAQETCAGCPRQGCDTRESGKVPERDQVGIVDRVSGPRGQYSEKIRFIEKHGIQN